MRKCEKDGKRPPRGLFLGSSQDGTPIDQARFHPVPPCLEEAGDLVGSSRPDYPRYHQPRHEGAASVLKLMVSSSASRVVAPDL